YDRAEKILTDHIDQLHGLAKLLIEKEKIDKAEFEAFMNGEGKAEETVETTFVEEAGEVDEAPEAQPETGDE
ncbi:MAG: cell division protein FtsH, partial [Clostridia bacterium]|nr:cell division protein FtsH [Clostridia bacterium]